ncbi:SHC-transforming protein 4 [Xenopus laevis]|uniref:SHC-transforming protein 4 n=2 Tax=Xenopus laevis TaxID=8355 RepID=A0A974D7M3_XENLA|nr:SHC-transforming protein 4 [Xenopus laevis]OCT86924.1 hypothetical protein XELAEV_18020614mg [Xenopus laevis]
MLQRTKYSRFRDESLSTTEDSAQSGHFNGKTCTNSHAMATPSLSIENITLVTQNTSNTLCSLIPKMANFKLSGAGSLLGLKHFSLGTKEVPRVKLTESQVAPSSPPSTEITFNSYLCTSHVKQDVDVTAKPQDENMHSDNEKSMLSSTPHISPSRVRMGPSYCVRYMGCIEVLQSMRSLDFGTRTQVTREAISRLCEAVPGAKGATKKRKPPMKFLSSILGKSNLQFSGMNVQLSISTNSLTLTNSDTQQVVANHHMQSISFASGGDPDTTDYVAYVAKDPVNQRACHIMECTNNLAQEVINAIGQAFELRFKQFLKSPSLIDTNDSAELDINISTQKNEDKDTQKYYNEIPGKGPLADDVLGKRMKTETMELISTYDKHHMITGYAKCSNIYENCLEDHKKIDHSPSKILKPQVSNAAMFDDPCYINTEPKQDSPNKCQISGKSQEKFQELVQKEMKLPVCSSLQCEEWYHGKMNRKIAEGLLVNDGDFLIRESTTSACQYVLSGLQGGYPKHLLLVDPDGKVRTKDHIFESVIHLISYHVENELPIISSGSELYLRKPVKKQHFPGIKD